MRRKWQGTALFAVIMAGVSVTVAGRALTGGGAGAGADGGAGGGSGAAPQTGATDAAQPSATPSPAASSAGSGASGSNGAAITVTGAAEQTRYGTVQVSVTYSGSRITSVQTLQAPTDTGRDQMLTNYAVPQLEQEVVSSQSARVDTISGATYTSEGYLASVQSAIDKHS
jgi:uncharacterized protein with FMN-binding domain